MISRNILFLTIFSALFINPVKAQQDNEGSGPTVQSFEIDSLYDGEIEFDSTEYLFNKAPLSDSLKIPCLNIYHSWIDSVINPYNIDFTTKPDTTFISCKGYYPPIVNKLNSDFGFRRWKFHYGVDIDLETGDSVHSAFDGMVRMATRGKRFGNYMVVRHFNGLETVYGHLKKIIAKPNQVVKAGEIIALGGSTGHSTGPHLHLEFRYLGQPINPHDVVDFSNPHHHTLKADTLALTKNSWDYVVEIRKIRYHIVRRGDTLSKISRTYGVSLDSICRINKMTKRKMLKVGQRIRYT